jgi:hypothetical protein
VQADLKRVNEANQQSAAAHSKFIRLPSKLTVFGFDKCVTSLQAYDSEWLKFRVLVIAVRDGKEELKAFFWSHRVGKIGRQLSQP